MTPPTGPAIRAWRLAHGLTQAALARRCGVSVLSIWRWEHDQTRPHPLARHQLAAVIRAVERCAAGWGLEP